MDTLHMGALTRVSVDEYLSTSHRPDCDFVDGELIERNVGTKDHSNLQGELLRWFHDHRGWAIGREGYFEALDGILRSSDNRVVLALPDLFQA